MKKNLPIIFLLILIVFYFQYSVTILWDSAHYMNYVNILERIVPFNNWDVVRGPVFPFIIFFGNIIFGKTSQGLLLNTFFYYLVMLLFVYKILNYTIDNLKFSQKKKKVITFIIMLTIIINPIIFGFYHSLLTEFVAVTLSVISCYLAVIWYDTSYNDNKKKYIIITIAFIFLTIFSWFLKQPYVSCGFFPLLVSYIITLFNKNNFKSFVIRTTPIVLCVICLVLSIKVWNIVLEKMGNDPTTSRNPSVSLGNTLISALGFTEIATGENIKKVEYIEESKLSKEEKQDVLQLQEKNKDYVIINIYDSKNIVASDYIESKNTNISTFSALTYITKYFFKEPLTILDSYFTNYLSIIDIYSTTSEDGVGYKSNKKIDLSFSNEITTIAFKPYYYGSENIFYMLPEMRERVNCYEQTNYTFKPINYAMLILGKIFLIVFKILFALLPFSLIIAIVFRCKNKNKEIQKRNLNLIIILLGFSFLHVMLHVVTGAIIDRYAIPAFISNILGTTILFVYLIGCKKMLKKS